MSQSVVKSFLSLKQYCEKENYYGWDPYDGLNSKIFNSLPFKKFDIARLIWIQLFKRNPINLRRLLLVPKEHNPMALALFLQGYCNLYNLSNSDNLGLGDKKSHLKKIHYLAQLLIKNISLGYSGACWGYNFDWQARRIFLFPKYTPTVVVTSFCVEALFMAYEITKEVKFLEIASSSAKFVLNDLKRTPHKNGFLFSYSPISGNNRVFNASLLGSKLLSLVFKYTGNSEYIIAAKSSIKAVCESQNKDGSWVYGLLPVQSWIDSFHTGFNLEAIKTYADISNDSEFDKNIERGLDFYMKNFFTEKGIPKYYNNEIYPIDIHCPGQLFVTLSKLNIYKKYNLISSKVMKWTLKNMQDEKGFFYYQIKKYFSSKISYMRWSNAFMFNSMILYIKDNNQNL